jgi:SET domain-containing protein
MRERLLDQIRILKYGSLCGKLDPPTITANNNEYKNHRISKSDRMNKRMSLLRISEWAAYLCY